MRLPGRLHITWENDNTLKMDLDAGTQTRRFVFGAAPARRSRRGRGAPPRAGSSPAAAAAGRRRRVSSW
jgi:hypothetical protein